MEPGSKFYFETYTRYSGVKDEKQKKKVESVFNGCFLRNLVGEAISF